MSFGSSPALDDDFDLIVDQSGDIRCTNQSQSRTEELEKDLAFAIANRLDGERGVRATPQQQAQFRAIVRNVINRDPRVSSINKLEIREQEDSFEMTIGVVTENDDSSYDTVVIDV